MLVNILPAGLPILDRTRDVTAGRAQVVTRLAPTSEPSARGQHASARVALAPAAMSALIEAQEDAAHGAPAIVRVHSVQVIDGLINRLSADAGPHLVGDAPLAVRRLEAARQQLRQVALQPAAHPVDVAA